MKGWGVGTVTQIIDCMMVIWVKTMFPRICPTKHFIYVIELVERNLQNTDRWNIVKRSGLGLSQSIGHSQPHCCWVAIALDQSPKHTSQSYTGWLRVIEVLP